MSEQFLVFAAQASIVGGATILATLYTAVTAYSALANALTKSIQLFHWSAKRMDGMDISSVQMSTPKNNTKVIGA